MQFTYTIVAAFMAVGALAAPADLEERAAPCTPGYRFTLGVCFQTLCNTRIIPSEADENLLTTPGETVQICVRKCSRDPDCDYLNFDNNMKRCTFTNEEGEDNTVVTDRPRYNAARVVADRLCT